MKEILANLDGSSLCVGIVRGRFNERVGMAMQDSCCKRLVDLGVAAANITVVPVLAALPLAVLHVAAPSHPATTFFLS